MSFTESSVPVEAMIPINIIPEPVSVVTGRGVFRLTQEAVVSVDYAVLDEATLLLDQLRLATGFGLQTASNNDTPNIVLRLEPEDDTLPHEGYRLTITENLIDLCASSPAGIFFGSQSLLQLLPPAIFSRSAAHGQEWLLPCVRVVDFPRFAWRGAMLDVTRHFMPPVFLRKFIDLLAVHKLNILQLHLNDDQAWRLEIRKYPRLTDVGGQRRETLVGYAKQSPADADYDPSWQTFDGVPHKGVYSQDVMRDIVEYARVRHVTIVPEIELPGHATAAIAAYPELGCLDHPVEVSPTWGIHANLFNAEERTISFLQDVLTEVADIFPSYYIHIGGDEAVKAQWRASESCQRRIKELGLQNEAELQSYMVRRMDEYLTGLGRRLVGWDEILDGGLAKNAVVMSWRGDRGGIAAAKMGHDVVMAPYQHTYLDYYQTSDFSGEPPAFPEVVTLRQIYQFEPVPADLPSEYARHILGAQGQLWTEYMANGRQVEYMAFPRLAALAEGTWSTAGAKDYAGFTARLDVHLHRLAALDVNYRKPGPEDLVETVEDKCEMDAVAVG